MRPNPAASSSSGLGVAVAGCGSSPTTVNQLSRAGRPGPDTLWHLARTQQLTIRIDLVRWPSSNPS